jgi:NitT/TauT family transport system permease protein
MKERRSWGRRSIPVLLFFGGLLGVWQLVTMLRWLPFYVFPSPAEVWVSLVALTSDGVLWRSMAASLQRMLIGFGLAALLGVALGLSMGISQTFRDCLKALFLGIQTLPSAAWVPIALLVFGLSNAAVYFVVVMSSMAAIAVATSDGISRIPPVYLRAAQCMGASRMQMAWSVVLPAALPNILTGLKLGWTMGWHGVVSAELIKSSIGLGFLLHMGRELNDAGQVVGIMLVTIAIGMLVDRLLFTWVEREISRRWGFQST